MAQKSHTKRLRALLEYVSQDSLDELPVPPPSEEDVSTDDIETGEFTSTREDLFIFP